jgi:hypothetical protein
MSLLSPISLSKSSKMDGWFDIDGNQVVVPRKHQNLNVFDLNQDNYELDQLHPRSPNQQKEVTKDDLAESAEYAELWDKLCNSITIHGVYFIGEARTTIGTLLWLTIVTFGMFGASTIIYDSYVYWGQHPILTTIKQIPVEYADFPSITICPLDGTQ